MLVEAAAVETLPPDSLPTDPSAALSAEVNSVREHGDPLDSIKSLAFGNVAIRTLIPAAAAIEVIETTPGWPVRFVAGGLALAGALLYENGRSAWHDRRQAKRRLREDAIHTADATGQFFEFYRTGRPFNRDVTLMWYGPPTTAKHPQTGAAGMFKVVDLARQAGAKRIAAPASVVKPWVGEGMQPYGSYRKWLLHRKQRFVHGKAAKAQVYEASPDAWIDAIHGTSHLEGLITLLGKVYPDHPIVRNAAFYAHTDPDLRKQKLLAVAQEAVDRRLSDVEGMRVDRHDPQAPFYPYKRRAAHVTGKFTTDGIIQRFINGHADTITTVATEMNLTEERITQLLADPSIDVVRGPQAIELAILRLLKEKKQPTAPLQAAGETGDTADETTTIPYQARLLRLNRKDKEQRRPKLLGHRLGRLALAGALVAGIGFGINTVQTAGQKYENKAYSNAYIEVAHRLGVPDDSGEISDPEVYAQMYADHPWLRVWDGTNHYANVIGTFLASVPPSSVCYGPCPGPTTQPVATNGESFLGNASDGQPNKVDWTLDPHHMSAAGDWSAATSALFYAEQKGIDSYAPDLFWEAELTTMDNHTLPDSFDPSRYPAYIAVSRQLVPTDYFMGESENTNCTGKDCQAISNTVNPPVYNFYYLPVRENSSPVAIRYTDNGKVIPVNFLPQPDGTYDISIPSQYPTGTLTYWIAPSNDRAHALKPSAYHGPLPYDQAAFQAEVAKYLDPKFYAQTPLERALAVENAIGSSFMYAVDPVATNEMRGVSSFAGYDNEILLHRKANCNEANTTLALVDPALNTVTGYEDSGSPAEQHGLYSHSAHLYDVNRAGQIFDATPSDVSPAEASYFATSEPKAPKPQPMMPLPWELGGAVLLLSGVGLWQRRRIARGINASRTAYGNRLQRQLVARGAAALNNTVEIVERGLYGPSLDIALSLRRATAKQQAVNASTTATKLVSRPDLHTPAVGRMLKQAQSANTDHQQTIDSSRHIIRKARLTRRVLPRKNIGKKRANNP